MAGAFPGAPNNLDLHTTDGGTVYQYKADHDRWVIYKDYDGATFVEVAGDTMTGDFTLYKAGNNNPSYFMESGSGQKWEHRLGWSSGSLMWRLRTGAVDIEKMRLDTNDLKTAVNIIPTVNKAHDIGSAAVAYDDVYCDDVRDVASDKDYIIPPDDNIYTELKAGVQPYIKPILIKQWEEIDKETHLPIIKREEVPLDYIAKEGEVLEEHTTRAHSHNLDYLNGVIRKLISEIEELKKVIGIEARN